MDYYHISAEDLGRDARVPLVIAGDSAEVFFDLALEMVSTIREHNARGEKTVFICPVGPVGHYPYFVKMVNDQENPQVEAVVSMDLFGESVEAHTIYQDGWCYVDTMGSKMKYAADYDEFLATQGENLLDASGTPTDFSSLEDVSITQDGDNRVISFTGGDALIEEIMGAVQDTQDMDITDASGQFTIDKDGYLSGQKFSFSASMDSDGMTGTMDMTIDLTLQNPGAEVTIQVDDPDSYEEVDPSAITDGTEGLVTE